MKQTQLTKLFKCSHKRTIIKMYQLIIVLLFFHTQHCSSVTVTLTGSADFAVLGQTFRFTCTVTDEDAPTLGSVSFSKDGGASVCSVTALNCSKNGISPGYSCGCVSRQTDVYFMNISNVSVQKDEGRWGCQRRSQASNSITLPVYYLQITSITLNSNTNLVTVNESDHVTMRCLVDSYPGSTIRLLNGSSELSRADNSLIEFNWTAACRQRGNYSCMATNNIDDIGIISKSIHLAVKCSPQFELTPGKEITAAIGDDTTLSVTLLSYPEPSITWRKTNNASLRNLTSIASVSRVSDISVTASLTLTGVQQEDCGEYLVEADNGIGKAPIFNISLVTQEATRPKTGAGFNPAGLIGGVVACVVIVLIVVIAAVVVLRRRRINGDDKEHITKPTIVGNNQSKASGNNSQHSNKAYHHEKQHARNSGEKSGPCANSLNYLEVEVVQNESNTSKSAMRLQEERTEYTTIQPGVRGPQLKDDDED